MRRTWSRECRVVPRLLWSERELMEEETCLWPLLAEMSSASRDFGEKTSRTRLRTQGGLTCKGAELALSLYTTSSLIVSGFLVLGRSSGVKKWLDPMIDVVTEV
jgi:hypothetical protein